MPTKTRAKKPAAADKAGSTQISLDLAIACLYERISLDRKTASHMQDSGKWDSERFHHDRANQCVHAINILQQA